MRKKVVNFVKRFAVPFLFVMSLCSVAYAAPTDLNDAKNRTLTVIQFIEGIATALFMAGFGFKAKWHWSLKNIAESQTDIEKHNKGFQRSILGLIGLLIMGVIIIYVTDTYK